MRAIVRYPNSFDMLAAVLIAGGGGMACVSSDTAPSAVTSYEVDGSASPTAANDGARVSSGSGQTSTVPPSDQDASGCRPGYVDTFQSSPETYHPATAAWQGVCHDMDFQNFFDACLGVNASANDCAAFKANPTHRTCTACIETPSTDSHYGPLVSFGAFVMPNVAGCIELTDPTGLACAKAIQTASLCERAACGANCPVSGGDSLVSYDTCTKEADQGACQSYAAEATSCWGIEADGGLSSVCVTDNFSEYYYSVVPLFCGAQATWVDASVGHANDAASNWMGSSDSSGGFPWRDAPPWVEGWDATTSSDGAAFGGDAGLPLGDASSGD
jgi:hypothetical protein